MEDTNKVVLLIIQKLNKYLLMKRPDHPEHKGEWAPISGHVKLGETLKETIIREALEELGIKVVPVKQLAKTTLDNPNYSGYWWLCKMKSEQIKPSDEILEFNFFSKEEIRKLKLWPDTRKLFEVYIWK